MVVRKKNSGFGFVVQRSTAEDPLLLKKLPCLKQRDAFRLGMFRASVSFFKQ